MAPDDSILSFVKDFIWAPLLGLVAWAWSRNQKEHDDLWAAHETLRSGTTSGHSVLNDRIMEYVDTVTGDLRHQSRRQSDKANDHIVKLFANAELDRKEFHHQMDAMRSDNFARHIELMNAIHVKADK
jgi:hypothetical protein